MPDYDTLYFDWLVNHVCNSTEAREYSDVLGYLMERPFTWTIPMDQNRANDGLDLRQQFADEYKSGHYFDDVMNCIDISECSVLEMMVALSIRLERDILNDDSLGNQTGKWFWTMMENVGIDKTNRQFIYDEVEEKVNICLERSYDREGHGAFFTVHNPREDMRQTDIWYQANWWITYEYLDWN